MTARRNILVRDGWIWHLGQDGWFQVRPVNDDEVPPEIEASAADLQSAAAVGARAGVPRPPARGPVPGAYSPCFPARRVKMVRRVWRKCSMWHFRHSG